MCLFVGLFLIGSVLFPVSLLAGVGVAPTALNFGSVPMNTTSGAVTVVITNYSRQTTTIQQVTSSLPEFVVIPHAMPISISPRGSASFQVVFKPNAPLTFKGSIVVNLGHMGGSPISIGVSGIGTSPPPGLAQTFLLSTSANTLNFGNTLVGSSASQAITLTNTATGSVNISQVASTGAGFKVSGFSAGVTLTAGQKLAMTASFSPTAAGAVAGSISVVSTATNPPATISLTGAGVQPQISAAPSSLSFGNITVGATGAQTLTIRNTGTAALNVTQASLVGTGFTSSGLTLPLSSKYRNAA